MFDNETTLERYLIASSRRMPLVDVQRNILAQISIVTNNNKLY